MARAAVACGAHGLVVTAHTDPATAYTDALQTVGVDVVAGVAEDAAALARLDDVKGS